jgi:hypothetical protein
VFVAHAFLEGIPGTDDCAATCLTRACSDVVAEASAMLLDRRRAVNLAMEAVGPAVQQPNGPVAPVVPCNHVTAARGSFGSVRLDRKGSCCNQENFYS